MFAFFALATIVLITIVLSSVAAKDCDNDLVVFLDRYFEAQFDVSYLYHVVITV